MSTQGEYRLSELLHELTSKEPVTEMTAQAKGELLFSVLLGEQQIQGWYRPRDLPTHPIALETQRLTTLLDELVFDPEEDIEQWRLRRSRKKQHARETDASRHFTDLVFDLGLTLRQLPAGDLDDPASQEWHWTALAQLVLHLLSTARSPRGHRWKVDVERCLGMLDFSRPVPTIEAFAKKAKKPGWKSAKYRNAHALLLSVARRERREPRMRVFGIRVHHIQSFVQQWAEHRKSKRHIELSTAGSAMVYLAIAVLRERLIRDHGPSAIVHDFGGWLVTVLPVPEDGSEPIDDAWVRETLLRSIADGGWLAEQFPLAAGPLLESSEPPGSMHLSAFPPTRLVHTSEILTLDRFAEWRIERDVAESKEARAARRSEDRWIQRPRNSDCSQCHLFGAVAYPHWLKVGKPDAAKTREMYLCCPVCCLLAGVGKAWRHRFLTNLLLSRPLSDDLVSLPTGVFQSEFPAERGKLAMFHADGDGVGRLIGKHRGLHRLRRLSRAINHDLQNRLISAIESGWSDLTRDGRLGLQLEWMGGDDVLLRVRPSAVRHFESAYSGENGWITYTHAANRCGIQVEETGPAAVAVVADVKAEKRRRRAEA